MIFVTPRTTRTVGLWNVRFLRLIVAGKCALSVLLLTCVVGCSHKSRPTSSDDDTSGEYDVDVSKDASVELDTLREREARILVITSKSISVT